MGAKQGQITNPNVLFSSDKQPENRKPRGKGVMTKFREELKIGEIPVNKKEAELISRVLLSKTEIELNEMKNDNATPVIIKSYINGILNDLTTGKTWTIDKLMDRSFGTVTHKTEEINTGKIKFIKTENGGIKMITETTEDDNL